MQIIKPSVTYVNGNVYWADRPRHVELCGRVCYKSEDRITQDSAGKFIGALIKSGHEAVLEHARITLDMTAYPCEFDLLMNWCLRMQESGQAHYLTYTRLCNRLVISGNIRAWRGLCRFANRYGLFGKTASEVWENVRLLFVQMWHENWAFFLDFVKADDPYVRDPHVDVDPRLLEPELRRIHSWHTIRFVCDRGVSHEIVRHRPAAYCQESTRYCNYSKGTFGGQITVIEPCFLEPDTLPYQHWKDACKAAEQAYYVLLADGLTAQEARDVLPTSLKTELVMTATAEEWLHFLRLRTSEAAHPQMREVANQVREILTDMDKEVFDAQ